MLIAFLTLLTVFCSCIADFTTSAFCRIMLSAYATSLAVCICWTTFRTTFACFWRVLRVSMKLANLTDDRLFVFFPFCRFRRSRFSVFLSTKRLHLRLQLRKKFFIINFWDKVNHLRRVEKNQFPHLDFFISPRYYFIIVDFFIIVPTTEHPIVVLQVITEDVKRSRKRSRRTKSLIQFTFNKIV